MPSEQGRLIVFGNALRMRRADTRAILLPMGKGVATAARGWHGCPSTHQCCPCSSESLACKRRSVAAGCPTASSPSPRPASRCRTGLLADATEGDAGAPAEHAIRQVRASGAATGKRTQRRHVGNGPNNLRVQVGSWLGRHRHLTPTVEPSMAPWLTPANARGREAGPQRSQKERAAQA